MYSILKISLNRMSKPGANENRSGRGKQNLFQDMCSLRTYSKKQAVFRDSLLVQETTQKGKLFGLLSSDESTSQFWSLLIWNLSDCTVVSKINQDMWEMVGSQLGRGIQQAAAVVGMGRADSSYTVDGMYSRSPSLFPCPFCFFSAVQHWTEHICSRKKDYFNSV